jgi:hypothetical protein
MWESECRKFGMDLGFEICDAVVSGEMDLGEVGFESCGESLIGR